MGQLMQEDDIFIPSFLELLNLRFAPRQGDTPEWFGGIDEMAKLQSETQVFQPGRSFKQSAAILGLGGTQNSRSRMRWFKLLESLDKYPSNRGSNADQDIVHAIIEDLKATPPLPVYFMAHDSRTQGPASVIISEEAHPLFYLECKCLTISLPMKPKAPPNPR